MLNTRNLGCNGRRIEDRTGGLTFSTHQLTGVEPQASTNSLRRSLMRMSREDSGVVTCARKGVPVEWIVGHRYVQAADGDLGVFAMNPKIRVFLLRNPSDRETVAVAVAEDAVDYSAELAPHRMHW